MRDESWERAVRSFEIEAECIKKSPEFIDKNDFGMAVAALKKAGRIAASGCGHSGIACMHFAHSMCCINLPARFISPSEAVHGALGFLKRGDVMVLASRGGKTAELLPVLKICKDKGVTVIGVSENEKSPLAGDSDIFIKMFVERESDRYDSQGTSSFVVLCAVFDALQVALIEETCFKNEDFAINHPGGAVGERLARRK